MGTVTAIRTESDAENKALEGLCALIEREVDRRLAPIEAMLRSEGKSQEVEEYLDKAELARRLHTNPKTVDDWVYKHSKTKIPFIKLPTGSIRFKWSAILAWMGEE